MKKLLFIIASLFMFACEQECEPDPLTLEELITELALRGYVIDAHVKFGELFVDGELFGVYPQEDMEIAVKKYPITVCNPFGWEPAEEWDWLCTITGAKGRALGKEPAIDPVFTDVFYYAEQGSEEFPVDMTSVMYFSRKSIHYPNYIDTNADPSAFYGLTIAKWGVEWGPAVQDWCAISHPLFCLE
jgi:hypothetical protein